MSTLPESNGHVNRLRWGEYRVEALDSLSDDTLLEAGEPQPRPGMSSDAVELAVLHALKSEPVFRRAVELLTPEVLDRAAEANLRALWRAAENVGTHGWPLSVPLLRAQAAEYAAEGMGAHPELVGRGQREDLDRLITELDRPESDYPESAGHDLLERLLTERLVNDPYADALREADVNSINPVELIDRFRPIQERIRAHREAGTRSRISTPGVPYTPEPVSWLIPGVLKRMTTLVAGPAQHLKSKLLLDIMVSLGTGGMCRALGHWPVTAPLDPGERGERCLDLANEPTVIPEGERILYLVGEDEDHEVEDMLRRVCRARGTTRDRCGVTLSYDPPSISTGLDKIVDLIREYRSTIVVLDTISALDVLGDDAEQSANMHIVQRRIRDLKRAVEGAGAVAFMVHHANKRFVGRVGQENYEPMVRTDIHGAGFVESAKQTILINRSRPFSPGTDPEQVWLSTGNRSRSTLCRVTLDEGPFNPRTGFRHHWVVTVEDQAQVAAAVADQGPTPTPRQAEAIADITAHLTEDRGWVGTTDLVNVTGQSREVTNAALRILVRRGVIERGEQPQTGPGNYYRRAEAPTRNLEIDPAPPPEGGVEDGIPGEADDE